MRKPKAVAQRIVSLTLRRFFNPLYRRGVVSRFPLAINIYSFMYQRLTFLGLYEPGTVTLIKRLLKKGMTFVDLGAHRGYYTLLASKLVGAKGRVFAFEPAPENFALLARNVKGRSNITLVPKAVSNKSGTAKFFLSPDDSITHSLYEVGDNRQCVEVEVTSLDEFFKDKDATIDFIKMDIEGAERSAIEGMANIIKKNENLKIVTEFWPEYHEISGCSGESFLRKLAEYGFKLYLIDDDKATIEPITIDDLRGLGQDYATRNLFCEKGRLSSHEGSE